MLCSKKKVRDYLERAFETGAATLGTPVTDTIKVVNDDNLIVSTPVRSTLRAVQTPQVFDREMYEFALDKAGDELDSFTDDCSLIEKMGGEVLRSGCCWYRGQGRVFYFSSGHETYPVYYQPEVRRVLLNAARWAAAGSRPGWPDWARNPGPVNPAP